MDILQLFLLINVFLIGILVAVAFRHARAHFWPDKHDADKRVRPPVQIPPTVKHEMLVKAQAQYQSVLDEAAKELQRDLKATSTALSAQLDKLGSDIVAEEMKQYRTSLDKLRESTTSTLTGAQAAIAEHQAELEKTYVERKAALEAQLATDMAAEKTQLMAQLDTKLADAVSAFLIETLQHNVDLGAQSAYLTAQLEAHKDDFKREINETSPAK